MSDNKIKVIGHTPPDTDSVCSPIVYAWFLTNIKHKPAEAFVVGRLNKETEFVLDYFGVEKPEAIRTLDEGDSVVIIDTNNAEELIEEHQKVNILEIIDHHKLTGTLSTKEPIDITIRAVGCSATIIWELIDQDSQNLPKEMAGLLLAAIISDTLKFTSPTTTTRDIVAAKVLAEVAEVDIDEFASELFEAKSDLTGITYHEILRMDSKIFKMGDYKVRISVLETTNPQVALDMYDSLMETIFDIKDEEKLDMMFFFAVDILKNEATLVVSSEQEKETAEKAFGAVFEKETVVLPGIVSRKKQVVPRLEEVLG